MLPTLHLSLPVRSLAASVRFFEQVLGARVTHRAPSGYVNVDFFGAQLTLKENAEASPIGGDLHFGVNLSLAVFEEVAARAAREAPQSLVSRVMVVDAGTAMERKKLYLRCPTGHLIELKGYRPAE